MRASEAINLIRRNSELNEVTSAIFPIERASDYYIKRIFNGIKPDVDYIVCLKQESNYNISEFKKFFNTVIDLGNFHFGIVDKNN